MRLRILFVSIVALLLSGCLSTSLDPEKNQHFTKIPYSKRMIGLRKIDLFYNSGVVSVAHHGKAEAIAFHWKMGGIGSFRLRLSGPAGLSSILIEGNGHAITVWKSMTKFVNSNSLKQAMLQAFGWFVPLKGLYYWALGLRAPGPYTGQTFDKWGHLTGLNQRGWTIKLSRYEQHDDVDVPTVIDLKGYGLVIKIAVKQWYLYPKLFKDSVYSRNI